MELIYRVFYPLSSQELWESCGANNDYVKQPDIPLDDSANFIERSNLSQFYSQECLPGFWGGSLDWLGG